MKVIIQVIYGLFAFCIYTNLSAQEEMYFGAGNDDGVSVISSSNSLNTHPNNTINGSGLDADKMAASRFLAQSTLGYNFEEIERTVEIGFEAWIEEQKEMPITYLTPQMEEIWDSLYTWQFDYYREIFLEIYPDSSLNNEVLEDIDNDIFGPTTTSFHFAWWQNTITKNDQLRQRMAYALSQIFVISKNSDLGNQAHSLTVYYDLLMDHAFGNFRDLLGAVTLSGSMGLYLSHYNNPKEIPEANLHPDENYAREIMQLFSIGLYALNEDGTRKKDANGFDIPTYNNGDIKELAKVFTGLGAAGVLENPWVDFPYFGLDFGLSDKTKPMMMYEDWHQQGEKVILGELTIPDGQSGMEDIEMTLDYLFNHENVGPFISRLLIQRLVKSNPSPDYIQRVAGVFADNGVGVRGDLFSTLKAILLDEEARSCEWFQDENNGHLIEPLLRTTQLSKAFELICYKDTTIINGVDTLDERVFCIEPERRYWFNSNMHENAYRQSPLGAPTVFNFYLPDYTPVGEVAERELVAPEFKIHDATTAINYINRLHVSLIWDYLGGSWRENFNENLGSYSLDTDAIHQLVYDDPEELYNYLDILFVRGELTDKLRNTLREFINDQPEWVNERDRVRGVLFLMLLSPDYTIMH